MIVSRHVNGHCSHPYCLQQDISNPYGNQTQSFCCKSPVTKPGVYDCHVEDTERLKQIKAFSGAKALIIIDKVPSYELSGDEILQFYIDNQNQKILIQFQKYPNEKYLFCEPRDYSAFEAYSLKESMVKKGLNLDDQSTFTGLFYDKTLSDFEDRNPNPTLVKGQEQEQVLISVIIPHFNHHEEIIHTLDSLERAYQETKHSIECIVVDDGSHPKLKLKESALPIKLIQLEREKERNLGDANYRAGIARNIGVSYSKGKILQFLDSDMLVEKSFFNRLVEDFVDTDILQLKRSHLKPSVKIRSAEELLDQSDNFYSRSQSYFESFQEEKTPWLKVQYGWKYFSTFGVAMKREVFLEEGGFSPQYCLYGFEDVDLGYRLWKRGYHFKKSHIPTIAQYHEENRSEYVNDPQRKKEILRITGTLFFRIHCDEEVFNALKGVIT